MSIGKNIKFLRKDVLKLSREKFGQRLGVSADVINNIELERLARPEQKEPLIKLLCNEFGVKYEWLLTGQGEMFNEEPPLEKAYSPQEEKTIRNFFSLSEDEQKKVSKFIFTSLLERAYGSTSVKNLNELDELYDNARKKEMEKE